jgi:hypothetical protein
LLHHPFLFWEETNATKVLLGAIKEDFWRRCRGGFFNIHQVPNHKSHLFALTLFAICLSFSSLPLHQFASRFYLPHFTNLPFYSPLFFVRRFSL